MPGSPQGQGGTRAKWQVAEAKALVHTLDNWSVVETMMGPTKTPNMELISSKQALGAADRENQRIVGATAVLNVERVSTPTKKEPEATRRVQVFDRFAVVLHVFTAMPGPRRRSCRRPWPSSPSSGPT